MTIRKSAVAFAAVLCAALLSTPLQGQVGKGLMDFNSASEKDLLTLPGMTPGIAKSLLDKRPFNSIVDLNTLLTGQGLTAAQTAAMYEKAFVHVNLQTCTEAEVMLIPRIGRTMPHEFEEYRPWKTWEQFDRNIGKYVRQNPGELERMKQYVFIPINLNTATDEVLLTIPAVDAKMLAALKQHRPWTSKEQFEREIGKASNAKEAARLWRYLVIQ